MADKFWVAGIDISADMTQAAYMCGNFGEARMAGDGQTEEDFLIPTAIERTEDGWRIGSEMSAPTEHILKMAYNREKNVVGTYDALSLVAIFAENVVRQALKGIGSEEFSVIVFALPSADKAVIESIRKRFEECGIVSKLVFITHAESCAYYVLNQKKELRANDVAFFDYSDEGLIYRKFHMQRADKRILVQVSETDCNSDGSKTVFSDESFKKLAETLFERQQISTVYLLGEGFDDESWARESLNFICSRRRTFKGRNLYALGACYKAAEGFGNYTYSQYCILCKGRTEYEAGMEVIFKEECNEAVLVPAGALWYETDVQLEGILSGTERLRLFIHSAQGEIIRNEEIILSDFPYRGDRLTRVYIEAGMSDDRTLEICVTDLGFGELAQKSGKRITKTIQF